MFLNHLGADSAMDGVKWAFHAWLGFALPLGFIAHLYSQKKYSALAIDLGYQLVYLAVMGAILSEVALNRGLPQAARRGCGGDRAAALHAAVARHADVIGGQEAGKKFRTPPPPPPPPAPAPPPNEKPSTPPRPACPSFFRPAHCSDSAKADRSSIARARPT